MFTSSSGSADEMNFTTWCSTAGRRGTSDIEEGMFHTLLVSVHVVMFFTAKPRNHDASSAQRVGKLTLDGASEHRDSNCCSLRCVPWPNSGTLISGLNLDVHNIFLEQHLSVAVRSSPSLQKNSREIFLVHEAPTPCSLTHHVY